ncbi:uncharacterized protein LOC144886556 [Branchiostoma floridae x Branchiostoma japonicum]
MMEWNSNELQGVMPAAPPPPYPGVAGAPRFAISTSTGRRFSFQPSTESKYNQHTRRLSQPVTSAVTCPHPRSDATYNEKVGESKQPQVTQHISRLRERLKHGRQLLNARSTSSRAESYTNVEENDTNINNPEGKTGLYPQSKSIHEGNIEQNRPIQQEVPLAALSKVGHVQNDPKHIKNNKAAATQNHNREKQGNSPAAHPTKSFREQLKQGRKLVTRNGSASSQNQSYHDQDANLKNKPYQGSEKVKKHLEEKIREEKVTTNPAAPGKLRRSNLYKEMTKQDANDHHASIHRGIGQPSGKSNKQSVENTEDLDQKVKEMKTLLSDFESKMKLARGQVDVVVYTSTIKEKLLEFDTLWRKVKGQVDNSGVLKFKLCLANRQIQDANEQVKKLTEQNRNSVGNLRIKTVQQCEHNMRASKRENSSVKEAGVTATNMVDKTTSVDLAIKVGQNKDIATEELSNLQQMQDEASALKLENDELRRIVPELKNILIEVRSENLRLRGQCEERTRDMTEAGKTHEEKERAWKLLRDDHNLLKEKHANMRAAMDTMAKEKEQSELNVLQLHGQLKEMESRELQQRHQKKAKDIETDKKNQSTTQELRDNTEETRGEYSGPLSLTSLELRHLDNAGIKDAGSIPSTLESGQECPTNDLGTCENANQPMQSQADQDQAVKNVEAFFGKPKVQNDQMKKESDGQVALDKLQSLQNKYSNLIKSLEDYKGQNGKD